LDKDIKASYKLEIKNIVTNKIRNIYFYKLNEIHEGTRQQADIDEQKVGKYVWTASANREWLESLNNVFTDRWLNALGNQINRKHYKQFRLNLGKKEFSISYDGVRNNFDQIEKQIKLPSVSSNSKAIELILMSKDVLTVFNALSTNEDIQNVVIRANENVILFKYSTQLGQYEIYIPTCKIQNKLITNAFKGYQ
jgi:hypothetical protein